MNKWYKILFRLIGFGLIVCIGLIYLSKVFFTYGDTYTEARGFYAEPKNSLDVIFVGSSSCARDVSSMKMWDEYGFASYSRATTQQAPVVTYEMLKDALKYQHPKVVVLFCEWLWRDYDYEQKEGQVRPAIDSMKMSWEKLELVNYVYAKDTRQTRLSYLFPFFRYHDRWNELEADDFKIDFTPISSYNKGQIIVYKSVSPDKDSSVEDFTGDNKELIDTSENKSKASDFCEESLKYYQKTIDLCKENDINVVIVKGCKYTGWSVEQSKMLEEFARQNNCSFLDYNYGDFVDNLAIKYPDDYADIGHLNYYGSLKLSAHLGGFLAETYKLPDRREDVAYQNWNEDLSKYYVKNLKGDITLIDHGIQCNILGLDDIDNPNIAFRYVLYKDGERIDSTSFLTQGKYTFEISESGTYRVGVFVYDEKDLVNQFSTFSELEVLLPN